MTQSKMVDQIERNYINHSPRKKQNYQYVALYNFTIHKFI